MSPQVGYAACMIAGVAVALALRRPSILPWRKRWGIVIGAIFGAGVGAKLPFVIAGSDVGGWFTEGKTILSGLAGGYLGVEGAKRLLGVRQKTGDSFAVPLAAAIAVGRWG